MEIERKFLVRRDGEFRKRKASSPRIIQAYMDVRGATVPIRLGDEKAYLTIKGLSKHGGIARYEFEREIPVADAKEMLQLCHGGYIDKVRHIVPYHNHVFEVDEFHGNNEGLLFCEVELESEDEQFDAPPFLGPEVSGNRHFYNKNLLTAPYSGWRDELPEEYR